MGPLRVAASLAVVLVLLASGLVLPFPGHGQLPEVLTATVHRDSFGVPHIYAGEAHAVWFANGYAQAQDRLWALDLIRHVSYGEASRVVGPGGGILEMDLAARRDLYSREQLEGMWEQAPEGLRASVAAFAAGVNRAAAEMAASGNLPAEFAALQHGFEPWTDLDTAAVAVFLLARFGGGGGGEIGNAQLLAHLQATLGEAAGEAAFRDLVGVTTNDSYPTIPVDEGAYPDAALLPAAKDLADLPPEQLEVLEAAARSQPFGLAEPFDPSGASFSLLREPVRLDLKWGSHTLVVDPALSADGRALLGGGPQTGYFNPQILYEVGLHGGGLDAVGVGVIGAPGIVLGRAAHFAWTVTSGASDQSDVVALPADGPRSYGWDGESRALQCREETHVLLTPLALGPAPPGAVEQEVCTSHLGPVVAVTLDEAGDPEWFFTERRASWLLEADSAGKWLSLDDAGDLEEFAQAFDGFSFTFNFHFAGLDASGAQRACFFHVGMQPVRNAALDPRFPTPAGEAWQWSGVLTGDELPRDCDPATGYYANWNNLPQRGWTSGDSRELWGSIHRVERLDHEVQQFLGADEDGLLTLDDVKEILRRASTEDSLAGQVVPSFVDLEPAKPAALEALEAWAAADYPWRSEGLVSNPDGELYDDKGHTVYDVVLTDFFAAVFGDEQGAFLRGVNLDPATAGDPHAGDHGEHNNPFAVLVDAMQGATAFAWCDVLGTDAVETCSDVAEAALEQRFGDAASGDDIGFTPQHFTRFTSLGGGPAYGMPMTNRATYYHFHVGSDATEAFSAIAPGQSGHLNGADLLAIQAGLEAPEHMRDQLPLYVNYEFKALPFAEEDAAAAAESTTTLLIPR